MRLDAIVVGDIVKTSIGGRVGYGEVLEVSDGIVRLAPLHRGAGREQVTAGQIVGHWRRAGRRRTGSEGESVAQPPEQLALRLGP